MSKYIDNNPWAGLSSYEDPEKAVREGRKPKLFCGRDDESHQVTQLISSNIFVTLYGKSGTGKTSLLNAGVFPCLRQKRYLPVSIRLSMDALDITFQQCIINRVSQTISEHQGKMQTIEVVSLPADEQTPDYLWSYFARTRFMDGEGRTLFPVIVLDQLEEIFRNRRLEAEALLRQVAYLMDESHALTARMVDGQPYKYDFNFRFVASIREDDLYRLEDSIDNNYLSELKRCRYRLRSLSEQGAQDVILIPGEGLFKTEEQKNIADAIISKSRNEDGSISTNIVSLLCSRIFVDFQKSDADQITPALVNSFIKGNPFERFYNEVTRGFSNKEKSYIEDYLVDSTGRRNSIPESDFILHVPKGKQLLEGDTRILQRTSTSSDSGNYRIELIHDSFCEPLTYLMLKRLSRKKAFSRVLWFIIILLIIFICVLITHLRGTNNLLEKNLYKIYSERINKITKDGNPDLAIKLLYEILPVNKSDKNKPWTMEAETALRNANNCNPTLLYINVFYNNKICFSPDGKFFVTSTMDGRIHIWNSRTRDLIKEFKINKENGPIHSTTFSPDGEKLLTISGDTVIRIWYVDTGKCLKEIKDTLGIECANYSPDGKHIVSGGRNVCVWDVESGEISLSVSRDSLTDNTRKCYNCVSYSSDGKIIAAASDSIITLWNAISGKRIKSLVGHKGDVKHFEFSNNGKLIVSASASTTYNEKEGYKPTHEDNSVKIWDVNSGSCLGSFYHQEGVNYALFSPDDKFVISASKDGYARIWDINSKECIAMIAHENDETIPHETPDGYVNSTLEEVGSIAISPTGDIFVTSGWNKVRVWKFPTGEPDITSKSRVLSEKEINSPLYFLDASQDENHFITTSHDSTLYIWGKDKCDFKIKEKGEKIIKAFYSNQDQTIVCICDNGRALFYDSHTGRYEKELIIPISQKHELTFSPDGKYLVCTDSIVSVWAVNSGTLIHHIECQNSIFQAIFNTSGNKLVVFDKARCQIWNVADWTIEKEINIPLDDYYYIEALSPDGNMLLTSTNDYLRSKTTCKIWNTNTGECVNTFSSESNYICKANFVLNNDYLFCISNYDDESYLLALWEVNSGENVACYCADDISSAYYKEKTHEIVIFSREGEVKIIPFPTYQSLMNYVEKRNNIYPLSEEILSEYDLDTPNYMVSLIDEQPEVLRYWIISLLTLLFLGSPIGILLFLLKAYLSNRKVYRIIHWTWNFFVVAALFAFSFVTYVAIIIASGFDRDKKVLFLLLLAYIIAFVSSIIGYTLLKRKFKKT